MGISSSCNSMETRGDLEIYHERQVKEMCALHALNNLFQDQKAFCKKDLDDICVRLSPGHFINPHRSMLGLGNYDVNVLMAAVQTMGCETVWFDKRKNIKCLLPENITGFILNTPSDYKLGILHLPFKRKHWIAIRKIGNLYYNLDSKLESPEVIGDEESLLRYLCFELENNEKELLIVVNKETEIDGSWRRDSGIGVSDTVNSINEKEIGTEMSDTVNSCVNQISISEQNSNNSPTSKPNLQNLDDL